MFSLWWLEWCDGELRMIPHGNVCVHFSTKVSNTTIWLLYYVCTVAQRGHSNCILPAECPQMLYSAALRMHTLSLWRAICFIQGDWCRGRSIAERTECGFSSIEAGLIQSDACWEGTELPASSKPRKLFWRFYVVRFYFLWFIQFWSSIWCCTCSFREGKGFHQMWKPQWKRIDKETPGAASS